MISNYELFNYIIANDFCISKLNIFVDVYCKPFFFGTTEVDGFQIIATIENIFSDFSDTLRNYNAYEVFALINSAFFNFKHSAGKNNACKIIKASDSILR